MINLPQEIDDMIHGGEAPPKKYTDEERKILIEQQFIEAEQRKIEEKRLKTVEFNKYHSRIDELTPEERASNGGDWLKTLKEKDAILISQDIREGHIAVERHMREKHDRHVYNSQDYTLHATDLGNSVRFIRSNVGNVKYAHDLKSWYIWDELKGVWSSDARTQVNELMKEQVKSLHLEAEHHNRDREAMTKWAFKCETPARIEACLTLAASDPDIAITTEDMDKDLMLFNFNNGTYDLEHDMFLPHDKLQNITKTCGYNYDPVARCPEWERFIERLFRSLPENDKKEIMEYIQKCVGYTLTGYTSEQIIILLHGSGGNGKSVFNECLRMLFGDYGMTIAAKTLTTDGDKQIRNDIAGLRGARFVSASENAKKSTLDEELIKKLTGGEPVQARFLNKEFFSFVPTLKLWWSFNHAPKLNDQTESIWRRVRLIPFNETFSEVERKPMNELMDIFSKELSGIFNWALYGFKKYKKNGLKSANIVESAVKSFREECDILYEWKIQNVIDAEPTTINGLNIVHEIKSTELYQNYITWCSYNHEKDIMNITRFGVELKERGFKKTRKNNGWYYVGIKFTQRI